MGKLCLDIPRLKSARAGTIAVMFALALPVVIGFAGLTIDVPFWYAQKTALQTATDAGAIKAARDLAANAATTPATLQSDALAAAIAASNGQFQLNTADFTVKQLVDKRQVEADAAVPAPKFFSAISYPLPVTIKASSTAGVAYSTISTQASCYAIDSFNYLYSTGFGTIDTSHSSGLDSYKCGSAPTPPSAYNAYCGGGVLGCSLDVLGLGNDLLPFAFQIGAAGGNGGLAPVLGSVVNTLTNLLGNSTNTMSSAPLVLGPNTAQCPGNVCTVTAGTYVGGITVQPGVTVNFVPNGANDDFLIENGDLVVSTQDSISAPNATFFMIGARPGAYIAETQVNVNTAPINSGAIILTSKSTFTSSSLIGTQTSAPISAMPYAQQQAETQGLLSLLGLPGGNLVGTNFESVVATCPQAASNCSNPNEQTPVFQSTLIPGLGTLEGLIPGLTDSLAALAILSSEGETSTTTVTSGLTLANGVATDWQQSETANSTLTNTLQTLPNVLKSLGVGGLLVTGVLQPILNAIAPNVTNSQSITASGVVPGQTSNGAPACGGSSVIYSAQITPNYGPGFTDVLNASGENGASGAVTTSDTITICGASQVATITPITPGTALVSSTAAGASTLALLK